MDRLYLDFNNEVVDSGLISQFEMASNGRQHLKFSTLLLATWAEKTVR